MLTSHGFSRAAVVGAGLMGRRIAGVLASAGLDVAITDTNAEILHAAAVEAARVAGAGRGSVAAAADLAAAIPDADLVIEAVVENLAVKQELFERLATLAPDAVLATNTSVLPIGAVTERVEDGSRVTRMRELDIKPELEIYDTGHLEACLRLWAEDLLAEPLQFSIVLGVRGGMAATADNLLTMVRRLPPGAIWQVIAIGKANMELTAMGLALGGNARVGLEDTLYLRKGELAPSNLALVSRTIRLAEALDLPIASVEEAEAALQLPGTS